ncbi:MAG: hypothetical protein MJ123_01745 [Lachnospiraceae bacterium]|nr:hypothetical protein [Lachnospiraceae bacterium]
MKKVMIFVLCILFICFSSVFVRADSLDDVFEVETVKTDEVIENMDILNDLANEYLRFQKKQIVDPKIMGFSHGELQNATLNSPFSFYVFDNEGEIISCDSWIYPVVSKEKVIAILEMSYNEETSDYCYTFGKAYSDKLNDVLNSSVFGKGSILFIGRVKDKIIISDGSISEILFEIPSRERSIITENMISVISEKVMDNVIIMNHGGIWRKVYFMQPR